MNKQYAVHGNSKVFILFFSFLFRTDPFYRAVNQRAARRALGRYNSRNSSLVLPLNLGSTAPLGNILT
ncbi:hypothetical protein J5N97_007685 [Dioscorea zingiberensis]|uniref:Uncharacterized protein n=1 Tax=Dioscorea zingiberensis TaxID=325984 RepID=A0A9D5HUF7_9LILI|nr:hypothetical protein J5N97_007685 [Dioscorea zingiberensis]